MSRDIDEIFKYKMYGKLHCPQNIFRQNQNPTNDIDARIYHINLACLLR